MAKKTSADYLGEERLPDCSCLRMKVNYFCEESPVCNNQSLFCVKCADDGKHTHYAKTITFLVNKITNDWVLNLIPKVEGCCKEAEERFKTYDPLIKYMDDIAKSLGLQPKYQIL